MRTLLVANIDEQIGVNEKKPDKFNCPVFSVCKKSKTNSFILLYLQ